MFAPSTAQGGASLLGNSRTVGRGPETPVSLSDAHIGLELKSHLPAMTAALNQRWPWSAAGEVGKGGAPEPGTLSSVPEEKERTDANKLLSGFYTPEQTHTMGE